MRYRFDIVILAACLGIVGCASVPDEDSPIIGMITAERVEAAIGGDAKLDTTELIDPFSGASSPRHLPSLKQSESGVMLSFGNACWVEVGRGGTLYDWDRKDEEALEDIRESGELTEEQLEAIAVLAALMGGSEPEIGMRAVSNDSWDGNWLVFTTSDGRYDVKLGQNFGEGQPLVGFEKLGRSISEPYDDSL